MRKLGVQLPTQNLVFSVCCEEQLDDCFLWLFRPLGEKDDAVIGSPSFCMRRNLPSTTCPSCGFQFSLTRSPGARSTVPALLYATGARGEEQLFRAPDVGVERPYYLEFGADKPYLQGLRRTRPVSAYQCPKSFAQHSYPDADLGKRL